MPYLPFAKRVRMTVSKALNPRSSEVLNMTRDALPMFSNLFSNALFTKQRKRIRCCIAA